MSISEQELNDFRSQVSAWMKDNQPADPGFLLPQTFMEVGDERQLEFLREWQHKVWSAGYLGMAWPKEYGGGGMERVFQAIADQEMRRHAVPICFNVIGLGWAGPLIIDIGTEEEKARYLKGILSAADARRAADAGCEAIVLSNHGGRQLESCVSPIDVLPEVVAAVGDRLEVYVDSGSRRGSDIIKAIALGARAVMVGRATLYGLAAARQP